MMEFYIIYEIILICLSVDGSIYKLKLRDTFRRHKITPTLWLPVDSLHIYQCKLDTTHLSMIAFRQTFGVCDGNRVGTWIYLKRCIFPSFNIPIFEPSRSILTVGQYCLFGHSS